MLEWMVIRGDAAKPADPVGSIVAFYPGQHSLVLASTTGFGNEPIWGTML